MKNNPIIIFSACKLYELRGKVCVHRSFWFKIANDYFISPLLVGQEMVYGFIYAYGSINGNFTRKLPNFTWGWGGQRQSIPQNQNVIFFFWKVFLFLIVIQLWLQYISILPLKMCGQLTKMDRRTILKTKSNLINQNRNFQTLTIKIKTTINFKRQRYKLILLICSYPFFWKKEYMFIS